jgi:hypothetical protein
MSESSASAAVHDRMTANDGLSNPYSGYAPNMQRAPQRQAASAVGGMSFPSQMGSAGQHQSREGAWSQADSSADSFGPDSFDGQADVQHYSPYNTNFGTK